MNRRLLTLACVLLLPACGASPCLEAPCLLADELAQGLLSVRALDADDVWIVGSSPAPDATEGAPGPLAAHWDGAAWSALDLAAWDGIELWWVHATASEAVLVGSAGTILELDRAAGTVEQAADAGAGATFFGVWGAGDGDLWAVGEGAARPDEDGDGNDEPPLPLLWRRTDGDWAAWHDPVLGPGEPQQLYFKVHGTAADDLWIVGSGGTALHWDGNALTRTPTDADTATSNAPLLTVDAGGERPIAVGGAGAGLILEWDGAAWRDASPPFQPGYNGVCTGPDGAATAVGRTGARAQRVGGVWQSDLDLGVDSATLSDLHACSIAPDGAQWAVGGRIASRPLASGVVVYSGAADIPPLTSDPGAL